MNKKHNLRIFSDGITIAYSEKFKAVAEEIKIVMALWGSLYPCVKIGYSVFGINSNSVADILMFAAMSFALCGALVCIFCFLKRKTMPVPSILPQPKKETIDARVQIAYLQGILDVPMSDTAI